MTANLTFIISERDNVIKIPNAAFRFTPQGVSSGSRAGNSRSGQNQNAPPLSEENQGAEASKITPSTSPVLPGQTRIVWTLDANMQPQRHQVKIGITDGTSTEMVDGDLKEGEAVITGETTSGTTKTANTQSAPGFGGAPGGRPGGR